MSSGECTCCGECVGCCVPAIEDPVTLSNIPWEISAPGCPAVDGATGQFVPVDPTGPIPGICGYCPTYCNVSGSALIISGILKVETGPPGLEICMTSPCSLGSLCLILECERGGTAGELSECCGRMRLWVGLSTPTGDPLVGDDGSRPPLASCGEDCSSWVKLSPTSCSCEGGLTAEFDLSGLQVDCEDVWESGPCIGQPKCCQIDFACSFLGATLVI